MALKDLIAEKGALDEATIERIVEPYVRYDVETKEIHFTPGFAALSNKAKILVFLVALRGWRFVTDDAVPSDARPAEIEAATGVPGGSLRPALRGLCETRHILEKDSRYSVTGTSLPVVESELKSEDEGTGVRRRLSSKRKPQKNAGAQEPDVEGDDVEADAPSEGEGATVEGNAKKSRKVGSKTGNIAATFERWIDEGYFDESRTLSDVQKRFRKEAIMIPRTSLPGYFLGAVRKGRLTRDEVEANGKTVWAYTTAQNDRID